jgi:hypothetical protein
MSFENTANLPLSEKWHFRPTNILSPFTLNPGATRDFVDMRTRGYVVLAAATFSSPNLSCRHEVETAIDTFSDEFTCTQLLLAGWTQYMSAGWWCSGAFPLVPSYTVVHSPSPWTPFSKRLTVTLINRTLAPIIVYSTAVLAIEFLNDRT